MQGANGTAGPSVECCLHRRMAMISNRFACLLCLCFSFQACSFDCLLVCTLLRVCLFACLFCFFAPVAFQSSPGFRSALYLCQGTSIGMLVLRSWLRTALPRPGLCMQWEHKLLWIPDGENLFAPRNQTWLTPLLVGMYVRESNSETRVSERWCKVDFATIHWPCSQALRAMFQRLQCFCLPYPR